MKPNQESQMSDESLLSEFTEDQLNELLDGRRRKVLSFRLAGISFLNIGKAVGPISSCRARQLYETAIYKLKSYKRRDNEDEYYGLSVRATNCLNHLGVKSKVQAIAAIRSGKLFPGKFGCRNYGKKSHIEVCVWAGIPAKSQQVIEL